MKDPYGVLGLDRNATPEVLKAKYDELHAIYSEQRFKSGEEGNEGARKLQELEEAWIVICANIDHAESESAWHGDYGEVDELIRRGKYNEAQDILDGISDRIGEWHYMQAIVFYKREWLSESKTQLEMALREDPNNKKYRASLDKLEMAMKGGSSSGDRPHTAEPPPTYVEQPQSQPADMSNCLSTCCCAYCLTDCLCNAMRCC